MMILPHIKNLVTEKNYIHLLRWKICNGDYTKRVNYDLNKNSTVLDVGGYIGEWCEFIHHKYNSNMFVFEPVPKFFNILTDKFSKISDIKTFNFGLGNQDKSETISLLDNASSAFKSTDSDIEIEIRDIVSFIDKNKIEKIDLIKLNVEGAEYDILDRLISSGYINKIKHLQIQFHDFVEGAEKRRRHIVKELNKTHTRDWNYPFIWEGWTAK